MTKFAIRLLTLALFAMASATIPMAAPAKAAADNGTAVKKKHKRAGAAQVQAPTASQYPRNMSEDPERKAVGGY
ncbi:MAG TPA: hypothetical protein VKT76_03780 [Bradyrhizobium sp.]|nr:hypothetical protein [Bradyrhizobium sp.]